MSQFVSCQLSGIRCQSRRNGHQTTDSITTRADLQDGCRKNQTISLTAPQKIADPGYIVVAVGANELDYLRRDGVGFKGRAALPLPLSLPILFLKDYIMKNPTALERRLYDRARSATSP
jgi:hypothetical protein